MTVCSVLLTQVSRLISVWPHLRSRLHRSCPKRRFIVIPSTMRKLNSKLLMANAWHSRTDALSSIAVLVGLVGVSFDALWLDAVAALVVALLIAKIALGLLWDSMQELIDTALPEDQMMAIRTTAMNVPGLRDVHQIRTRTMAGKVLVDLHLQVDPRVSHQKDMRLAVGWPRAFE